MYVSLWNRGRNRRPDRVTEFRGRPRKASPLHREVQPLDQPPDFPRADRWPVERLGVEAHSRCRIEKTGLTTDERLDALKMGVAPRIETSRATASLRSS